MLLIELIEASLIPFDFQFLTNFYLCCNCVEC